MLDAYLFWKKGRMVGGISQRDSVEFDGKFGEVANVDTLLVILGGVLNTLRVMGGTIDF